MYIYVYDIHEREGGGQQTNPARKNGNVSIRYASKKEDIVVNNRTTSAME